MKNKNKNNSVSYFDMQFITSSISTTLVLLLLGLVVFFVLGADNLSIYVRENINFSVLISDDMKEADILKLQKKLDKEPFVKQTFQAHPNLCIFSNYLFHEAASMHSQPYHSG